MNLNWDLFRWHYPKKFQNHFLLKSADDLDFFCPLTLIFLSPPSTPTWHADARESTVIYGTAIPHSFQEDDVAALSILWATISLIIDFAKKCFIPKSLDYYVQTLNVMNFRLDLSLSIQLPS